jgi:hypothetical protein
MGQDVSPIIERVERLRQQMYVAIRNGAAWTDPEIVSLSKEIDQLIERHLSESPGAVGARREDQGESG